jgi:hypothetical protein
MRPRPNAIVDRLEITVGVDGAPKNLNTAISIELEQFFGLPAIQASEHAERVAGAVAKIIASRAVDADEAGTMATLVLLGTTSTSLAGFCHVLPTDTATIATAKLQRRKVDALAAAMRSLTFDQFEQFGAQVLREIGAADSRITRSSGDQGIDFFGHLSLGQYQATPLPFTKLTHDVKLSFVGQAKHYPNNSIGPSIIRELIGAVSLARTKTFSVENEDVFPGIDLKPFSPAVIFLFTTGKMTSGAAQLAKSAGIIARSGDQLALFLADKGIGMKTTDGGIVFDERRFSDWLNR